MYVYIYIHKYMLMMGYLTDFMGNLERLEWDIMGILSGSEMWLAGK